MAGATITDPFFRQLYARLEEEIDKRVSTLVAGGAMVFNTHGITDLTATGAKYQKDVAYIDALQQVVALGIEIDHERYSTNKRSNNDGD